MEALSMKNAIIVFGAGKRGEAFVKRLQKKRIPVLFVCDNDKGKYGTMLERVPVVSPNEILKHMDVPVFIATKECDEIKKQLSDMGVKDFYEYNLDFYEYYGEYTAVKNLEYGYTGKAFGSECVLNADKAKRKKSRKMSVVLMSEKLDMSCAALLSLERCTKHIDMELLSYRGCDTSVKNEYVLILNPNDWLQEGAVDILIDTIEAAKRSCVVGSKLVTKSGEIYSAGKILNNGEIENPLCGRSFLDPMVSYVRETDALEMSGIMMTRECWELWMEIADTDKERDFWLELKNRGVSVIYQPKSVVVTDKCVETMKDHQTVKYNLFAQGNHKYRGNMLLVDCTIAMYDQNAGARCVAQYIDIFRALNMRIIYMPMNFSYDDHYTDIYQQKGLCVVYGEYYRENYAKWIENEIVLDLDYAFLNRPNESSMVIDSIRKNPRIIVSYFGHDLHYLRMMREYELTQDEELKEKAAVMEKLEHDIIDKADYAGYPSKTEVDYLKTKHSNVEYYPLYYFSEKEWTTPTYAQNGIIFIGGFTHNPNVDGILWFAQSIYPLLREKGFNDSIYIVGANPPKAVMDLDNGNVKVTGYLDDDDLQKLRASCRLGFVPLRFGAGMKGKVLEMMYAGLPIITTSIGAEGLNAEEAGLTVADEAEAFADEIIKIYGNLELIKEKSIMEQNYIQRYFGEQQLKDLFLKQIEGKIKRECNNE